MNRAEFLSRLNKLLDYLPSREREDILYDYEEHFRMGISDGKTEKEIVKSFGSPESIAKQYRASLMLEKAEYDTSTTNMFRAIFATISLGFFNIVFVLGPFLGVVGVLLGLFGVSIGVIVSGFSLLLGILLDPLFNSYISIPMAFSSNPLATVFLAIAFTSLGLIFFIGNCYLTKLLYKITLKYLKFNLRIIKK